jgi:hypothetical protein
MQIVYNVEHMMAAWNLCLQFSLIAITNKSLQSGIWNLLLWWIINILINPVQNIIYKSTGINMAMVQKSEIKSDKFDIDKIE